MDSCQEVYWSDNTLCYLEVVSLMESCNSKLDMQLRPQENN